MAMAQGAGNITVTDDIQDPTAFQPSEVSIDIAATPPARPEGMDFDVGDAPTFEGSNFTPPTVNLTPPSAPGGINYQSPSIPSAPSSPGIASVSYVSPTAPNAPAVTGVTLDDLPDQPEFSGERPDIDIPDSPSTFSGIAPTAPSVEFQDSPTVTEFVEPEISLLPDLVIPELTWSETEYDSELLQAFNNKLLGWINGLFSTGLDPAIEQAIWNRARERTNAETRRLKNNVTRAWSAAGWTMPAPTMTNALLQAEQEAVNKTVEESRSVAVAQAELEQKNLQFAFSTTMQLEGQLMTNTNAMRQRLFEAQKANIELMISAYEIMQKRINLEIEILKARASVWETTNKLAFEAARQRLELEKTKVEVFAAQIQAFSAEVQANGQQWDAWAKAVNASLWELEAYKADADIFKAKVDGYKGLVDASRSKAEVEIQSQKLPIDLYQAKIQGYGAQVDGEKTRATVGIELAKLPIENYKANIQGYSATVDAIAKKADVDVKAAMLPIEAFKAEVNAYASQAQAETAIAKLQADLQQLPVEIFKAEVQAFVGVVEAEAKRIGAIADMYGTDVQAYKATVDAEVGIADVQVRYQGVIADAVAKNSMAQIEAAKGHAQIAIQKYTAVAAAAEASGKIAGNLAASAMSAINASGTANVSGHTNMGLSMSDSLDSANQS